MERFSALHLVSHTTSLPSLSQNMMTSRALCRTRCSTESEGSFDQLCVPDTGDEDDAEGGPGEVLVDVESVRL